MSLSLLELEKKSSHVIRSTTGTWRGQTFAFGCLALLVALGLAWFVSAQVSRATADVHTIANDSIPSVDAAQRLETLLQDLDATSADYLSAAGLPDLRDCVLPGGRVSVGQLTNHDCDARAIPLYRELINEQLYLATRNVTYPGEETAIRHIQTGIEEYLQDIARMQSDYEQGKDPGPLQYRYLHQAYLDFQAAEDVLTKQVVQDTPSSYEQQVPSCTLPGTTQTLAATEWTQGSLQTKVRCLAAINSAHLNTAYNDSVSFLQGSVLWIAIGSLAFVLLLLLGMSRTIWLSRKFLHVFLLVGVVLAAVGCASGFFTLISLAGDTGAFHRMVISDRISVDAAARIGDYATAANADESRYLIAENYNDATAIDRWQQDWQANIAQVGADLHIAYKNITYHPAEDQAYAGMDQWWKEYNRQDTRIRTAISTSNPKDPNRVLPAQEISTGDSDKAFGQFIGATEQLAHVNQQDYGRTLNAVLMQLQTTSVLVLVCLPLAGLCILIGSLLFAREL